MKTELDKRKQAILVAVIETYIKTGEPVGSKVLVELLDNSVSSATIRNEMAELVAMGYLEQPHTSAGRVPSAVAFRLYIDKYMPHHSMTKSERRLIDNQFEQSFSDSKQLVSHVASSIAEMTGLAALSTTPETQQSKLKHVEIIPVSKRTVTIIVMTDSGSLRSKSCRLGFATESEVLRGLVLVFSSAFLDMPLSSISIAQVQSLFGAVRDRFADYAPLFTAFYELIHEDASADIALSGQLNILAYPDYDADRARDLLTLLSAPNDIISMLANVKTGFGVLIGDESPLPQLNGSSLVVAKYRLSNKSTGTVGIIGPLRMNYSRTISHLDYISKIAGNLLEEILKDEND